MRMIQYAAAWVVNRDSLAYWMPRLRGHDNGVLQRANCPAPYAGCFAFASIWPMASTTASKVSSVEAWRAL